MSLHATTLGASRAARTAAAPSGAAARASLPPDQAPDQKAIEAALARLPLRFEAPDDPRRRRLRFAIADILAMPCGAMRLDMGLQCCTSDMEDPQRVAMLRTVARVEMGAQVYVSAVKKAGARFTMLTQLRFAQKLASLPPAMFASTAEAVFGAFQWGPTPAGLAAFIDALLDVPFDDRAALAALVRNTNDYTYCEDEPAAVLRDLHAQDVLRDPDLLRVLRDFRWQHPGRAMRIAAAARDQGLLVSWLLKDVIKDLEGCDDFAEALPILAAVPANDLDRYLGHVGALQRQPFDLPLVDAVKRRHALGEVGAGRLIDNMEALPYPIARLLLREDPTPEEAQAFFRVSRGVGLLQLSEASGVRALLRLLRRDPHSVPARIALAESLNLLHRGGSEPAWLMICLLPSQHLAAVAALGKARGVADMPHHNLQRVALAEIIREVRSPATRVRDAWRRAVRGVRYAMGKDKQLCDTSGRSRPRCIDNI